MRFLKVPVAFVLMFMASGCAIHGCDLGGKFVCDPDNTNCRWEVGFSCKVGPPYPAPYPPSPWAAGRSAEPPSEAPSLPPGIEDANGDGWLTCEGAFYIDTTTFVGHCE